ncbi:MFS transporter [Candidatus Woesearchaeota archaeon CG10_big_fil_rev_8_21_14_0_10_44_13]|nr:MAG: MFS transporter [Candidatus Woesearchaeota archaeon CG10_big_fil_rev_8_21_14_0_10_44_13]
MQKKIQKKVLGLHKNIFLLGIVSFLTDVSSEMIFSVFSVFFTVILGASAALLGLVEGLADFSASSLDYVSGFISDRTGKRKRFAAIGYVFSTLAKAILMFANSVSSASAFRVIERIGKSFRGPPRDAWIASLSDKNNKGYYFGVHKALDKAGAIIGPFIAYGIFRAYGEARNAFGLLFLIALVPAVLAVILVIMLKDKPSKPQKKENIFMAYKDLSPDFRHYLFSSAIFSLAYFSFGFLLLKAYSVGFAIDEVVLLYALFNVAFVLASVPIGKIGDRIGRSAIISSGYMVYFIMALGFVFAKTKLHVIVMFILFGIFYSIDEGQGKAYISDIEQKKRATALGLYSFLTGLIYLPASLIAGYLWTVGQGYTFGFAALVSLAALVYFRLFLRK